MKLFELRDVSFRYPGGSWILKNVNLHIDEGERIGLLGPSGYGKSTLAQIMSGYLKPVSGSVLWKGKPLPERGFCPVQMIWQHPERAVNPRWRMKRILSEAWTPDGVFLKSIGIEQEWMERWPIELSGGELQRTFLAQVFAQNPQILILDEPANHLDLIYQKHIFSLIETWLGQPGRAVVSVVHDLSLARKYGTHAVLMHRGQCAAQGKIGDVMTAEKLQAVYEMDVYGWMREMLGQWA